MELSDSYIAGFFDGEGCITSQLTYITGKYEKYPRVNVQISITQKDRKILEWIQERFLGTIHVHDRDNLCYHLRITGKINMGRFLRAIQPYSVVKKEQIELALELIDTLRDENLGCLALPKAVHLMRAEVHDQLKALK